MKTNLMMRSTGRRRLRRLLQALLRPQAASVRNWEPDFSF
jgi:hypothetical protein